MNLDHDLLQEIKSRAKIEEIIGSYIEVIKKGRNYFALCPFHDDHSPSLHIDVNRQSFHCYVDHIGGDVFSFVEKYEKISFVDAVKKVAQLINFDDPRLHDTAVKKPVDESLVPLYNCISDLEKFYQYSLTTEEGEIAANYLKNRNISEEQISKFGLGYAIRDGKLTINYLQKKGYSLKNIEDIGIALARGSDTKDGNSGRLIFPLLNISGQVVGFSARKLNKDGDDPKFVNSTETKIFKKGCILYNLQNAKQTCKQDNFLYVVEGFMDVFAIDSLGISSVVALMGTAMTNDQVQMLKKLNVEIRLCLDGDDAGQKAMMKIMSLFDENGIVYRIVASPSEKRDPDEILQEDGPEKLKKFINELIDPFNFALNYYENISPLGSMNDRIKVINHFLPMISKANTKLEQDNFLFRLAKATNFEVNALRNYLNDYKNQNSTQEKSVFIEKNHIERPVAKEIRKLHLAEKSVILQMINVPDAIGYFEENINYFYEPVYRRIANFLSDNFARNGKIDLSSIMSDIQLSDTDKKEETLSELSELALVKEVPPYSKGMMDEFKNVINVERQKIFTKKDLKEKLLNLDIDEKAKLIDEYAKNKISVKKGE